MVYFYCVLSFKCQWDTKDITYIQRNKDTNCLHEQFCSMVGIKYMECTDTSFVRKASPQIWAQTRKSDEYELLEVREIFKLILLSCRVEFE